MIIGKCSKIVFVHKTKNYNNFSISFLHVISHEESKIWTWSSYITFTQMLDPYKTYLPLENNKLDL
jgi:hypothetical protein